MLCRNRIRPWIIAVATINASMLVTPAATAATASTVVGATVPSATSISTSACAPLDPDRTDFGIVTPGSSRVTTLDCDVAFGSSNDTAQLRIRQADGVGVAMWASTTGALDVGFDGDAGPGDGIVVQPTPSNTDWSRDIAVQPDGRIVVADDGCGCLSRYLADGTLDPTFDGPAGTGDGLFDDPLLPSNPEIVIQPDRKILVAGTSGGDFAFTRYLPDGSHDATFDGPGGTGNGSFVDAIGAGNDSLWDAVLLDDGRFIAAGVCTGAANDDFCVARYHPDGRRDESLVGPSGSGAGAFIEPIGAGLDQAAGVRVQPDGRFVVAGTCRTADDDTCVARYEPDGSRDITFDGPSGTGDGEVIVSWHPGGWDTTRSLDIQPDGKLLIGVQCENAVGAPAFCALRLNGADGDYDTTFDGPLGNGDGKFDEPIGGIDDMMRAGALLMPDGRFYLAGWCWDTGLTMYGFCVSRYESDGSRDITFDGPVGTGDGEVWVQAGNDAGAYAMGLLPDGGMVLGGSCRLTTDHDQCLVAFDGGGQISDYLSAGGAGDTDWESGGTTNMFAACLRAVTGGASAQWSAGDPCSATDGTEWNDVPETSETVAFTSAIEPDPVDATASLRFGLRASSSQAAGRYMAPLVFEVVAPDA